MQPPHTPTARHAALALLVGGVLWTARAGQEAEDAEDSAPPRPNVVLVLADDMGYSDIGCFGGEIATPNLDALAAAGLRFTQFYNASRCSPSRAALLTGLWPHRAGVGHMTGNYGVDGYRGRLAPHAVTIAEALRTAGYATLMTGKWHVGSKPGQRPTERGFDRFYGTPGGGGVYFKKSFEIRDGVRFFEGEEEAEIPDDWYVTDALTERALAYVEEVVPTERPFFLYLAHIAPHWPLQAKAPDIARYRGRYADGWDELRTERLARMVELGVAREEWELSPRAPEAAGWTELPEERRADLAHRMSVYAAQVDSLDQSVGRVVRRLAELGVLDDTLFLFLSDNGCTSEGGPGGFDLGKPRARIGTPGSYASLGLEWGNASNAPFRRFKSQTHEGGIATPLIVHWPAGLARRGELEHQPGHVIDLLPTILELTGADFPTERDGEATLALDGVSLVPALRGEALARDALYFEHEGQRAVRRGRWKLVAPHGEPWELYDLESDRAETRDLARSEPERVAELAALWTAWAGRVGVEDWPGVQPARLRRQGR